MSDPVKPKTLKLTFIGQGMRATIKGVDYILEQGNTYEMPDISLIQSMIKKGLFKDSKTK